LKSYYATIGFLDSENIGLAYLFQFLSMVNIHSATAEIRRGKKKDKKDRYKNEETTAQKYNGLPYTIGRP